MKTFIEKLAITIIPVALLAVLVIISSDYARKTEFHRSTVMSQAPSGPVIPGSSYNEVLNNLFSSSWR